MNKKSLFIVIEGLDGSGKTSVSRRLTNVLNTGFESKVKLTFEPHDPSCAGLFIRQVLMKKIENFHPRVLALAFAANRLDHCQREINPWLEGEQLRMIICDRYYLSSLVYQSSEDFPFRSVMKLNEVARKPDIIFFLNVSNEVCYERMKIRNLPQELFEENLSHTRNKYHKAIEFLRSSNRDNIVEVDGSGDIDEVVDQILEGIYAYDPGWKLVKQAAFPAQKAATISLNGVQELTIENIIHDLDSVQSFSKKKDLKTDANEIIIQIKKEVTAQMATLGTQELFQLCLDHIRNLDILVGKTLSFTSIEAYELEYQMPAGIVLKGAVLMLRDPQRPDLILQTAPNLYDMSDFLLVFSPGPSEWVNQYYERDKIQYNTSGKATRLFPSTKLITQRDLANALISNALDKIIEERGVRCLDTKIFAQSFSKFRRENSFD